ncbi:hypothetical protein G9C98_006784 [Cotesia typhae]|uniref:NELF-A N-terminal domain-containing protein n=1 Tax=Cotesia typhae TaxID=2053667 RepID=A0A8J5QKI1_9HYME|nr:hypothetical protein G9C98_006784 [Cotesia typhae]
MANVRDSDTSLWLHNKLGISNDSWTGSSICSQLNAEVLRNIKDCFAELQTQVKLKLLLSFFHIPRRNVEECQICDEDPPSNRITEHRHIRPGRAASNIQRVGERPEEAAEEANRLDNAPFGVSLPQQNGLDLGSRAATSADEALYAEKEAQERCAKSGVGPEEHRRRE